MPSTAYRETLLAVAEWVAQKPPGRREMEAKNFDRIWAYDDDAKEGMYFTEVTDPAEITDALRDAMLARQSALEPKDA